MRYGNKENRANCIPDRVVSLTARSFRVLCVPQQRFVAIATEGEQIMALKTRLWMTGSLEWFALIGDEEMFLGRREVPSPLEEGDTWTNDFGSVFRVEDDEIRLVGNVESPQKYW